MCRHIAAVIIKEAPEEDCPLEDDPDVIGDIENQIDCLVDDVVSDSSYDEEANYYEDWEINKYDLENNNDEVEEEYTSEICERIMDEVVDPNNAVLLLHRLHKAIREAEFDNGGFDNAIFGYEEKIKSAFALIGPDVLVNVLSENTSYRGSWAEKYLDQVPSDVMASAMDSMRASSGILSDTVRDMMLENGEYERYLSSGKPDLDDLVRLLTKLEGERDIESLRVYADRLGGFEASDYNWNKFVRFYRAAGMNDRALDVCMTLFVTHPSQKILDEITELDCSRRQQAVDAAFEKYANTGNVPMMTLFASNGYAKEINRSIIDNELWPKHDWRQSRHTAFSGYIPLCRVLVEHGYTDTAAKIGRAVIEIRLAWKDSDAYQDAVDMMKMMDGYEEFESLKLPHSRYKSELREKHRTMRKFWGLYDGTWVGKSKKRDRYYWRYHNRPARQNPHIPVP